MFATDCRLEGIDGDGYSVAFDAQSENLVVHRACWDRMLAGRPAAVPVVPDKADEVETDECASAERTDALSFME